MQDLEKLKLDIFESSHNGAIQVALELIARCENAEKELATCINDGSRHFAAQRILKRCERAEAELKELREQKPVGYISINDLHYLKLSINGVVHREKDKVIEVIALFAAPVAQSQESAEQSNTDKVEITNDNP